MLRNNFYVHGDTVLPIPSHLHFGQCMLDRFQKFGDNVAIISTITGESLTYHQVSQLVVDIALSLARIGVGKGQVVGICSKDRLEYMATVLGIICSGATYTSIADSGKATVIHRTGMVKPRVVFCSQEAYQECRDALESVGSVEHYIVYGKERCAGATLFDEFLCAHAPLQRFIAAPVDGTRDHAAIFYSSGTTGQSKCVALTHLNMIARCSTVIGNPLDPKLIFGRRVLTVTDFYMCGLGCFYYGATVVFIHSDSAAIVLGAIDEYKIDIAQMIPSTIFEMVKKSSLEEYDLRTLQRIVSCAAPLRPDLLKELKDRLPTVDVRQIYGCMECGAVCSNVYSPAHKPGSVGPVLPDVIAKVVDVDTRQPLGSKQRGEICVKWPGLSPGYLGDNTFTHLDEEGFYKTGDMGYYDHDKHFYVIDRMKDIIKYSGYSIPPAEIEMVLAQHPAVLEAAAMGVSDEQYYELPTAFVVLRPGADVTAQELTDYVNSQMASCMPLAGGVRFLEMLPRGTRGKLDRKALKLML